MRQLILLYSFLVLLSGQLLAQVNNLGVDLTDNISQFKEPYCENEFNKSMQALLKDEKKGILSKSFNLAALKVSYRQLRDGMEKQTLERYISKKVKELNLADRNGFRNKVQKLYEQYGESKDLNEISSIIEGLNNKNYYKKAKRLSNKEGSVFILALSMYDHCQYELLCLNKNDAAITWFMDEMYQKAMEKRIASSKTNLMQLSVKVAHTSGVIKDTVSHTAPELLKEINDLKHDIDTAIINHKKAFLEEFEVCAGIIEQSSCLQTAFKNAFDNNLSKILKEVQSQNITYISANKLKLNFANALTLNFADSLKVKKAPPKIPDVEIKKSIGAKTQYLGKQYNDSPNMCGGKKFNSDIEYIKSIGFDISKATRYANGGKNNALQAFKSFMNTFKKGVTMGGIKVSAFVKSLILNFKWGKIKSCCNDTPQWKKMFGGNMTFAGGVEAKVGINIGFLNYDLVGIGGLIGVGISIGGGASRSPAGCESKTCFEAKISPSVYGGFYVDVANNWVGGELKVSWKPYITGRQCMFPIYPAPKLQGKWSTGSIWLHGTLQVGWLVTYNYYELLYKNNREDSFEFSILP